jgi:CRP-like cAMP-binding protein
VRPQQHAPANLLQLRLGAHVALADHELARVRQAELRARTVIGADRSLMTEGRPVETPYFLMAGWAASARQLADGRRQLLAIHLPGDILGLHPRPHPVALTTVVAITSLSVVDATDLAPVWREPQRYPGLSSALDMIAAEEEHYLLGHVARLGRQSAYERMAHLFCELEYRLQGRGLSSGASFAMPMTQELLADALGLSVVHVNRTLQQMRREGRIELGRGRLSLLDLPGLCEAGEFRPPRVSATP